MAHCPTPILIVSASTNRGELFKTYDALAAGRRRRAGEAARATSRSELGGAVPCGRQAGVAHPGDHAPAGAAARPVDCRSDPPLRSARQRHRSAARRRSNRGLPAGRDRRLDRRPRGDRRGSCASAHRVPVADPVRPAHRRRSVRLRRVARRPKPARRVRDAPAAETVHALAGQILVAHRRIATCACASGAHSPDHGARAPFLPAVGRRAVRVAGREYGQRSRSRACSPAWAGTARRACSRSGARAALTIAQDEATSVVYGMPREAALLGAAERTCSRSEIGRLATSGDGSQARR